jgi:hypothetical protein
MLQFLSAWLAADHGRLAVSLRDFIGNPAYGLSHMRPTCAGSYSCSVAATASRYPGRTCSNDLYSVPLTRLKRGQCRQPLSS